nr:probable glutamate carboxypeptidase LAMP1 isoform X2 [Tanacetum cinerariifolium]
MFSKIITTIIALTSTISFLFISSPSKSYYHKLYLSPSLSDNASISHHLYTLTRRPHLAGSEANAEAASYVLSTLSANNIKSHLAEYAVLLTYPDSRSLTLIRPSPEPPTTFSLKQEVYEGDPYADVADQVEPSFHAYAKSGSVKGPVAYVNYGRVEDYTTLGEMGINVSGAIVLARYGEIFRGDIIENAYDAGAIGVLIYSDRKDYGGAGGDTKWFPDDKWLPPSGVQVGTVFNRAGDPSTPGWPSNIEGCERLSEDEIEKGGDIPLIPSLPISGADGEEIIKSIGGVVANDGWQGDKDAPVYRVGPGPGIIDLTYKAKQVISTIQNVIGIIEGAEEPDRYVILGNHRDAWTFGAVDPNSGTAALLEVAERLEKLRKQGWKPRRSIILCNWDAEEYGLVGSTEWVEENREMLSSKKLEILLQKPQRQHSSKQQPLMIAFLCFLLPILYVILGNHRDAWTFGAVDPNSGTAALLEVGSTEWVEENRKMLSSKVVAYLNVDIAVSGAGFQASATPQLDELITEATKQVQDPDNSSQTVYDSWVQTTNYPEIGRLGGGGSDYAAFVQHIGVPATDISFGNGCRKVRKATETRLETSKKYHLVQLGCRGIWTGLYHSRTK